MGHVFHAAILRASADDGTRWGSVAEQLLPGAHAILMGDTPTWERSNLRARKVGLEVRDTIAILSQKGLQFAVLLRKQLKESSITEQLLKTGTGALNIDASRVFTDWNEPDRPDSWKKSGHSAKPDAEKIAAPPGMGINCHPKGRWPANLVLVHGEGCRNDGLKRVAASSGVAKNKPITAIRRTGAHAEAGGHQTVGRVQPVFGYGEDDGTEMVANWNCVSGCPVVALDRQSGERGGGFGKQYARKEGATWSNSAREGGGSRLKNDGREFGYGDSGGASRFYKQFQDEIELINYLRVLILPNNGTLLEGFPS
jgi:hypothetical protein